MLPKNDYAVLSFTIWDMAQQLPNHQNSMEEWNTRHRLKSMVPLAPCHLASSSFRNTCAYKKGALPQWWFISSSPLQRAKRQATWIKQPTVSFLKCLQFFGGWLVIKMVLSTNHPTNQLPSCSFQPTNMTFPVFFCSGKIKARQGGHQWAEKYRATAWAFHFGGLVRFDRQKWQNSYNVGPLPVINGAITLVNGLING